MTVGASLDSFSIVGDDSSCKVMAAGLGCELKAAFCGKGCHLGMSGGRNGRNGRRWRV